MRRLACNHVWLWGANQGGLQLIQIFTGLKKLVAAYHPKLGLKFSQGPKTKAKAENSNTTPEVSYLKAECPRCLATRSRISTSLPCSCNRSVFASTSRRMRLKCSLSTRSSRQLFSLSTIVAALGCGVWGWLIWFYCISC